MQIKYRILSTFLIVSLSVLTISFGVSFYIHNKIITTFHDVGGEKLPGTIALSRMASELYHIQILLDKYQVSSEETVRNEIEQSLITLDEHYTAHKLFHQQHADIHVSPEIIDEFSRLIARYLLLSQKQNSSVELIKLKYQISEIVEKFTKFVTPHMDKEISESFKKVNEINDLEKFSEYILLFGSLFILLLAVSVSIYLSGHLANPIIELTNIVKQVAAGNLDIQAQINTDDEIGKLGHAFNRMTKEIQAHRIKLEKSNYMLSHANKLAKLGHWEWDLESNQQYWSDQMYALYGLTKEQGPIPLKEVKNHFTQSSWVILQNKINTCLETGKPYQSDIEIIRPNGTTLWVMARGQAVKNKRDKIHKLVGTLQDINDRKTHELEILKLSTVIQQSPENVIITNPNSEIEYVNDSTIQNSGYSRDEIIGQNPNIFASGKTPAQTYMDMWASLKQGLSWKGEFINKRKDGTEYTEFARIIPILDQESEVIHYVAVKEDITEKKRNEKELDNYREHLEEQVEERTRELEIAKKDAESANASKSLFLANMSHEIRTPMNGVIGMTHLALQTNLDSTQRDYIQKAHLSAQNLLGIINDILDFSKIEAGKLEVETTNFSMPAVLQNTLNFVKFKADESNIKLVVNFDKDVPRFFIGDPLRIGQILTNLVTNAIKFSGEGESVIISLVLKSTDQDTFTIHFSVKDNGIGISSEIQQKLFQSFSQADSSTTRKHGGTGLGLRISKELVELMKGKIWVDSEVGKGSDFQFILPLKKADKESVERQIDNLGLEKEIEKLKGKKFLLVDDDEINQEVARKLLVNTGVTVITAYNGLEALSTLESQGFDLVLMDCMMPEMDGYEATKKIRENENYNKLPVIAMTANAMKQDVDKVLSVGMNDHIAKPINPNEMFLTILKWV